MALAALPPGEAALVAVSGGGDSMALLHATAIAAQGRPVLAATVDHGLRPEAAAEAALVARHCAALGIPHAVLHWRAPSRGNLQAAAREGRRRLLAEHAKAQGASLVLLGHTADDQAETVLMRLARGSGVDGLAGMPAAFRALDLGWMRPFLGLPREALRLWLRERAIDWVEDPSNADLRFARARARAMMEPLATLGLTRDRLLRMAGHMAAAERTLWAAALREAEGTVQEEAGGTLRLDAALLERIGVEDTAARLLAAALMWVGGRDHRPRWDALMRLAGRLRTGRGATLAGCLIRREGAALLILRETRNRAAPPAQGFAAFLAAQAEPPSLSQGAVCGSGSAG
ncbi:tRNA(Ile)-lysidine synthetase [Rubellimicrobium thermophilum DSM 16684]|uniref:tRNA(Ile)-lysidine synthase n=1 Tax=Rubellimicrobium thermophilum DSM 16684 TaxID=1123069 RepID=S9QWS2_9RHOB|nr:tRNA lysidine(34) synthetase TilS [Rubellimicrobium thermophilum]EPX85851.1 tRNA(Ile)-lysidine synthetase [Rubellimicrobium thermophilum DSM 16684]